MRALKKAQKNLQRYTGALRVSILALLLISCSSTSYSGYTHQPEYSGTDQTADSDYRTPKGASKVLVRCLETNKDIIVTINDRGPHVPGRIIDLSYTGAIKLGIVDKGLTHVTLELLNGAQEDPEDGHFSVQLASFTVRKYAKELSGRIRNSKVVMAFVGGKAYYRVKVTGFDSRQSAESFRSKVRSKYPGALVIAED